jgi:superfamily I DNA and/or RNA helicase
VNFVRVDGQFHRSGTSKVLGTKPVEAKAVVAEVRRRFDGGPDSPSVGVVTFNLQQRALIESLLRDTENPRIIKALDEDPEGLFVKNLENVQGDERDVILFSTGFSKNDKGYLPLNFGPLNRAGGERRLNVAVTRAWRQVIVFSSFSPSELRTEETSSVGIKHLRSYLDLAEHGTGGLPYDGRRTLAVDLHREEIAARSGTAVRRRDRRRIVRLQGRHQPGALGHPGPAVHGHPAG